MGVFLEPKNKRQNRIFRKNAQCVFSESPTIKGFYTFTYDLRGSAHSLCMISNMSCRKICFSHCLLELRRKLKSVFPTACLNLAESSENKLQP